MPGEHENVQPLLARSATLSKLTCPYPIRPVTLSFCGLCSWLPAQMLRDTGDRLELAGAAGDGAAALDEAATGEAAQGDDAGRGSSIAIYKANMPTFESMRAELCFDTPI